MDFLEHTMESYEKKTDQELVALTLQDKHAFLAIVERYQAPFRRYIVRLGCRDPHDQDDVLQEAFLKIYVNLNDYDSDLKFSSWVYRIAHNEAISFFRKKSVRQKPVVTEEELKQLQNIADELDVAEEYNKAWDAKVIQQAITELDEQYRDVLVLKFMEEKSYNEISDILKVPIGTVGTLINRGEKQLKKVLQSKNLSL